MVLNSTNGQLIAQILKSDETDLWKGQKVVLYDDPSVSFGGKLTGGIRVRAPRGQAAAKPVSPNIVVQPKPAAPTAPVAPVQETDEPPF